VVMCIQTPCIEIFDATDLVPVTCVELCSVEQCCEYTELMYMDHFLFYINCVHLFNVGVYSRIAHNE
jgi:hypothetical protein